MSAKISETIKQFVIPNEFSPEIIIKFKALSKEVIQQMKMVTLEDEYKYHNICTLLKEIANPKAAYTIAKWEKVASAIKTIANLLKASNKDMIERFDYLSETIIENMPYVPAALFSDFRSACSRLKDCPNLPASTLQKVEKWNRLLNTPPQAEKIGDAEATLPTFKVLLDEEPFTLLPASFKQGTYLNCLLSRALGFKDAADGVLGLTTDGSDPVHVKAALQDPSQVELTEENIWDILTVANRYEIQRLKKRIIDFAKTLPLEHVILCLRHGHECCLNELYNHGLSLLDKLDKESLQPFLLELMEIAKQRKDSKLAKILFHALTEEQSPITEITRPWILEAASRITSFTDEEITHWNFINSQESLSLLSFDSLTEVNIKKTERLTPQALQMLLSKCPHLKRLSLDLKSELLLGTIQFNELEEINLSSDYVTDHSLEELLKRCSQLKKFQLLQLSASGITGTVFNSEVKLDHLIEIDLYCNTLTDAGIRALLSKCPKLQKLHLRSDKMRGTAFDSITIELSQLIDLKLQTNEYMNNDFSSTGVKDLLEKCPNLQTLQLQIRDLSDAAFASEKIHLDQLTSIQLSLCVNLTDHGVKALLEKCPKLQEFAISGWAENAISGAFFLEEVRLPQLRQLVLGNCPGLTNDHLRGLLVNCPELHSLCLWGNPQVTGAAFEGESIKFENLTDLFLEIIEGWPDEDAQVEKLLNKCPMLQNLRLSMNTQGAIFSSPTLLLKRLQNLTIKQWDDLDGNHLKHLPEKCPRLQKLCFTESAIFNQTALLECTPFPHLTDLNIEGLRSSLSKEMFITFLEKFPQLKHLNARGVLVKGVGEQYYFLNIASLLNANLAELETISLSHPITDENKEALFAKFPKLREIR